MAFKDMKFPRLAYNPISIIGFITAVTITILLTFLYIVGVFAKVSNPYLGIFMYLVLPPVLIFGLLLVPAGMWRTWYKLKKTGEIQYPTWPYVDLNKKSHRNATFLFFFGSIIFLLIISLGVYEGYHYTESVTFCGTTCHTVMDPEYIAYQNSPHARVACVSCHVGPGADWYAKSKLSGLYQVYAVIRNIYPKPIPTPIENLRPARETCEQCHWPERFFGGQQRIFDHFMYNDSNTHWPINMLIKVGGGNPETGLTSGIHWHTFINNRIEYIARDEQRQEIPWVKATNLKTGREVIFQNTEDPLTEEELAAAEPRVLDCMDCHNRPSHIYNAPDHAVDEAIFTGRIDRTLPEVKRIAVEVMAVPFDSTRLAGQYIDSTITDFYVQYYPEIYNEKSESIKNSIAAVQHKFGQNIFPEMKVRWDAYPNNIGHFTSPGCMRCHDNKHQTSEGESITVTCTACHTILSQGSGQRFEMAKNEDGLEFVHPEDIDDAWKEMGCFECHTGTQP